MDRERLIDAALWALAVLLLGALVVLSVLPDPALAGPAPVDLVLHVTAYAPTTLTLLLAAVWRPGRGQGPFPKLTIGIAGGLLTVGVLLEVVQALGWVGPRQGQISDALANAIGVGLGAGLWSLVRAEHQRRRRLSDLRAPKAG